VIELPHLKSRSLSSRSTSLEQAKASAISVIIINTFIASESHVALQTKTRATNHRRIGALRQLVFSQDLYRPLSMVIPTARFNSPTANGTSGIAHISDLQISASSQLSNHRKYGQFHTANSALRIFQVYLKACINYNFRCKTTTQYSGATSQATQAMHSQICFSSILYHTKWRQCITISSTFVSAFNSARALHQPK